MKKLITALLVLSSFAAQAQKYEPLKITNTTYPGQVMTFACATEACDDLDFKSVIDGKVVFEKNLSLFRLEEAAARTRRSKTSRDMEFYENAKDSQEEASKAMAEGYVGRAILEGTMMVVTGAFDTATIPVVVVHNATNKAKVDSAILSRGSKRIVLNLETNFSDMKVKHKYFVEMYNSAVQLSAAKLTGSHAALFKAFQKEPANSRCTIVTSYQFIQLYVNGDFKGNYSSDSETEKEMLAQVLARHMASGTCQTPN